MAKTGTGPELRPWVLAFSGIPALLALVAVVWGWPKPKDHRG